MLLFFVVACVAFLRFWNIAYGLPSPFNCDEPHLINLAMYFGSGDLNPHIFKYPTLWPYTLFISYSALFLTGKLLGFWSGVQAFGQFFAWNPTPFYFLGRT